MYIAAGSDTTTLQLDELCRRLRAELKAIHPANTAKAVASDIEADPRTVEEWLSEARPKFPIARHLLALVNKYGEGLVFRLFAPEADVQRDRDRMARLEALDRELTALKREMGR